jgi:heme A synthase
LINRLVTAMAGLLLSASSFLSWLRMDVGEGHVFNRSGLDFSPGYAKVLFGFGAALVLTALIDPTEWRLILALGLSSIVLSIAQMATVVSRSQPPIVLVDAGGGLWLALAAGTLAVIMSFMRSPDALD